MKEFYTLEQAATELNISRQRVHQLLKAYWKDKATLYCGEYHKRLIWLIPGELIEAHKLKNEIKKLKREHKLNMYAWHTRIKEVKRNER